LKSDKTIYLHQRLTVNRKAEKIIANIRKNGYNDGKYFCSPYLKKLYPLFFEDYLNNQWDIEFIW